MVDPRRGAPGAPTGGAFGPNAWLVDDMYEEYRTDPASVSESWREFFADYVPPGSPVAPGTAPDGNGAGTLPGPAETDDAGAVATGIAAPSVSAGPGRAPAPLPSGAVLGGAGEPGGT